jgi:predicted transcriptional regulator
MKNVMKIELDKELSKKVAELATSLGLSEDEVVVQIVRWYIEECNKQ